MKRYTVAEIARALQAEAHGNVDLAIVGPSEPGDAGPEHLALAMDRKYEDALRRGAARAAILWHGADWQDLGLEAAIFVPRPRYALSGLTALLDRGPRIDPGIHPAAIVDASASIAEGAAIGPLVVIGAKAVIGPRARIAPHVTIDEGARIGADCILHAGVRICADVIIGDRFIAQPNAVIGGDGFSFVTPEASGVERARTSLGDQGEIIEQGWTRIHSLGAVEIGDDVEIGSNSCIDRGTIRSTRIGSGTKIDNHVQIGHNCVVGRDCLFCGDSGLAGSVVMGDRCVLGGKTGVADNLTVGDDVIFGGGTGVLSNVPSGRVMMGYPAMKMETFLSIARNWRRLPRLVERVDALQKAVSNPRQSD